MLFHTFAIDFCNRNWFLKMENFKLVWPFCFVGGGGENNEGGKGKNTWLSDVDCIKMGGAYAYIL